MRESKIVREDQSDGGKAGKIKSLLKAREQAKEWRRMEKRGEERRGGS